MELKKTCPQCSGTRLEKCTCNPVTRKVDSCEHCAGKGKLGTRTVAKKVVLRRNEEQYFDTYCKGCNGQGKELCQECNERNYYSSVCWRCNNTRYVCCSYGCHQGMVQERRMVEVIRYEHCSGCHGAKWFNCDECDGHGFAEANGKKNYCNSCRGAGQLICPTCQGEGQQPMMADTSIQEDLWCNHCNGEGSYACKQCNSDHLRTCTECNGKGQVFTTFGVFVIIVIIIGAISLINLMDLSSLLRE